MENEPTRRRVRRAKQSRPVAPGHADPSPSASPAEAEPAIDAGVGAKTVEPDPLDGDALADPAWTPEPPPDAGRDGAWLPAGITVLVMVSLLVCAGLVLIASRQ